MSSPKIHSKKLFRRNTLAIILISHQPPVKPSAEVYRKEAQLFPLTGRGKLPDEGGTH